MGIIDSPVEMWMQQIRDYIEQLRKRAEEIRLDAAQGSETNAKSEAEYLATVLEKDRHA